MNKNKYFIIFNLLLFSFCLCDISVDQKEKLLNGIINYYNNLPNQIYTCDEGSLQNTQQVDEITYRIVATLKVKKLSNDEVTKLQCTATVQDVENGVNVVNNHCQEPEGSPAGTRTQESTLEATIARKPVQLDNEIQADTAMTSGEQFIAIPRDQPIAPCVGCSSHINPQAAGVNDFANLGIRHLDIHEPAVKHDLDGVLSVERQVQVINGVRYILTLSITFDNCSIANSENCASTKICKITILVKPWIKLPNGNKYRAILANNCTEEWQYGDNGEVLPEIPSDNNVNNHMKKNTPIKRDDANSDEDIRLKQHNDVQFSPHQEKSLTDEEILKLQEQIIPNSQFPQATEPNSESITTSPNTAVSKQHVFKVESDQRNENSIPVTESGKIEPILDIKPDKKKAIDDLLDFFEFSGYKHKTEVEEIVPRIKRSYGNDLQVLSLVEDYQDIKKSIENAKFVYELAQAMVDYLNEMDMEVKNRAVKNVIRAEEEMESLQNFVYIQARVTIPCDKVECEARDIITQICNGVIDTTNKDSPQILNTFCYNDNKDRDYRDVIKEISPDDPVLLSLANEAVKKIESESTTQHAIQINKIVAASTQITSGRLTKISIIIDNLSCNKSVPFSLRVNCTVLEQLGTKICEVIVHERHWLKERTISYTCTDRPTDMRISKAKSIVKNITVDDPKVFEMLQEAIQYLETQSNRNNKQKIVNIKSISSQIIAGFLTKIEFVVGYTNCTGENYSKKQLNKCELLKSEGLRMCKAQIWDRSWIMDGRQVEVSCDDVENYNEIVKSRKKRSIDLIKGKSEQGANNLEYKKLAEESLRKFLQSSSSRQHYEVVKVYRVTSRAISGKLTTIDFSISPTNCLVENDGLPLSSECKVLNSTDILRCHSKILDLVWLDKKQYSVNCNNNDQNQQADIDLDGLKEQNPSDSKYYHLAEESLQKYLHDTQNKYHRIIRVEKVTTQIGSGLLTHIDFKITPKNESGGGIDVISCHSKILEKRWLGTKDINVTCMMQQKNHVDDLKDDSLDNPKYMQMAVESLQKYIESNPDSHLVRVAFVDSVVEQNEGITKIEFVASQAEDGDGDTLCQAEFFEQRLLRNDIEIKCHFMGRVLRNTEITEDDPNYFKYIQLADESIQNYLQNINSSQHYTIISLENVSVQWDKGIKTHLEFIVSPVDLENNELQVKRCVSQIQERPWLNKKNVEVNCKIDKDLYRSKRQALRGRPQRKVGSLKEEDSADPRFQALARESLQKYIYDSRNSVPDKLVKVEKVTTQVVAGLLTRIDFVSSSSQDSYTVKCHSEVWEKPWENFKEIKVSCQDGNLRAKRESHIAGGRTEKDPNDLKYKKLAEESLEKYVQSSKISKPLKVARVEKVTTQVVAGSLTRIDFVASSSQDSYTVKCHSEVWEKDWENFKEIKVSCQDGNLRAKREVHIAGGLTEKDPNDLKYTKLAEESLEKFVQSSKISKPLKVARVEKVTTQVVAGRLTRIDFVASSSQDSYTVKCHSEVWEKPWENFKEIKVSCQDGNLRAKTEMTESLAEKNVNTSNDRHHIHNLRGRFEEVQDPKKEEFKSLAEESLRKYQQKSTVYHKVVEVKRVETRVVSGLKYKIDFTAAPTECSVNVSSVRASNCEIIDGVILYCHSEIWDRPWLKRKKIDIECFGPDDNDFAEYGSDLNLADNILKIPAVKGNDNEKYRQLAEEASEKYLTTSNRKYVHKVTEIHSVSEHIVDGKIIKIEYSISPTKCLRNETRDSSNTCEIKQPLIVLHCNAKIWDRPWLHIEKDIKVTCKKLSKRKKNKRGLGVRTKRQIDDDNDNEIDEDTIYYYADRAVQNVNDHSNSNNLHKLVTIHAVQNSLQMKTQMVRMYIEIAETFCLRHHKDVNLHNCDEMDGLNHRLCLVRLWPSPDDELVVRHVSVVCDDNQDFESVTALNIAELLRMSIVDLERSPDNHFKLVHQGEPQVIPSLDSKIPIKLNFIIATTNCTKDVNLDKNPFQCFIDNQIPAKACHSFIWLIAQTRTIRYINAKCPKPVRSKRSIYDPANVTSDNLEIQKMVTASLEKLEMSSLHRYKQRVLQINSHSTKITTGKVTTIDFDVGYTSCLKYEWVENITSCDFIEHLPRRRCVAQIWERLWISNGRNIDVNCVDDETPLESHIEFESAEMANQLAREALKHIEAKYPHPKKQKVVRIFSLEKQVVAGIHYRMKIEVGFTDCVALSEQTDCKLEKDYGMNKFCRINVWVRPWTDHPPNFRVSCDYQEGATHDLYHHIQAEQLFYNFLTTYSPNYVNDHSQMQKRFEIFKTNVKKIHEYNVFEKGTATYGVTRFTDLTYEEFSSRYMGLKPSLKDANQVPMKKADIPDIKIPQNFDWRDYDAVTDVKDQGSCGSCWAFSVTGNIEGQWKMQSGQLISLSEQELVDCDKLDDGCNGGLPDNAYRAIEQLGGLELESDYPYEAEDAKCEFNKTFAKVQISGAVNITTNETGMAQWLVHNGPISIGINANAMQFYMGGISHPWKMLCNPTNLDHGVLVVGFGVKDYPLFHKQLPYWIVKNSWGKSWGEQGYYRVYRGDGTCGVNQMASSAVV